MVCNRVKVEFYVSNEKKKLSVTECLSNKLFIKNSRMIHVSWHTPETSYFRHIMFLLILFFEPLLWCTLSTFLKSLSSLLKKDSSYRIIYRWSKKYNNVYLLCYKGVHWQIIVRIFIKLYIQFVFVVQSQKIQTIHSISLFPSLSLSFYVSYLSPFSMPSSYSLHTSLFFTEV